MTEIIHTPFGQEHPYEQLPEERFPRRPHAGESFTVGIVTRPPGAAQQVIVHTAIDGTPAASIPAERLTAWKPELEMGVGAEYLERVVKIDQDVWQAKLIAPADGQTLTYRIEADGEIGSEHTLIGADWHTGGGINVQTRADGQLEMRLSRSGQTISAPDLPSIQSLEWLSDGSRVRIAFACGADDAFFGFGERYNALNQRGNLMDIRVYEEYKNQGKRTYMPIPFLLSSAGYGVYVQSSRWMQFDLTAPDRWTLEADLGDDGDLRLIWFKSDDPLDIISAFTRLTGPAALPPDWAFGLWMSANEWNSQARVLQEVAASEANGIDASVLVIEAWSDETTFYIWNDAQYQAKSGADGFRYGDFTFPPGGKWPDPKAMVDTLHEHGLKLILWQIPAVKVLEVPHAQHEADRAYFEQAGFGVHEPDGSLYQIRPFWFRGGYLWDVTNSAERAWWLNKRAYLLDDLGVDGFKTDGGEHLWSTQVVFHDGRSGAEVWNEYPQRYSEAYYQFVNQRRPGLVFSRAGFTGSQRSPAHWAGDENSTWDAFRHTLLAGLSAAISGISFWGWDIGGFSGALPSAELYLRGAAMATFCPIMQYHAEFNQHREPSNDRTPWNMQERTGDTRVIPTFRFFTNVRRNLLPYIWQEAQYSARTGQPMMRTLKLWHPAASDYQYFFGRDLLVCPVVEEGARVCDCYLPPGMWFDLWTKRAYQGNEVISVPAAIDHIPIFVRQGSRIPVRFGASAEWGEPVSFGTEPTAVLDF
ncbi:MAG TPA: TIM-barrel domain-containing protein [Phototrophicaceae bacterium]|nr:TIM-barrel domain-containing protein [Phototrophicaceae bacterium]